MEKFSKKDMQLLEGMRKKRIYSFLTETTRLLKDLESGKDEVKQQMLKEIKLSWLIGLLKLENLSNLELRGFKLKYVDLSTLDFSGTAFHDASLEGCNLSGCNFKDASFHNSTLAECDLEGASYENTRFINTQWQK